MQVNRARDRRYGVSVDPTHLTPSAVDLLSEPNDRRIRAILSDCWVHYPRANQILRILNRLLEHPRTTRMPSIAVYGDSGIGKTMIMEKFRRDHPPHFDPEAGIERTPALALQMASKPGERRLYAQIVLALGCTPQRKSHAGRP
jgi:predicted ATPase